MTAALLLGALLGAAAGWTCCLLRHRLPLLRRRRQLGDVYDFLEQQWEQRWHR